MKIKINILQTFIFSFLLILAACSQSQTSVPEPTDTPQQEPTSQPTVTVVLDTPTATELPSATPSPSPTVEILPSATPTLEASATPTQPSCTNIAEVDRHLSISDGSILNSGLLYGKVWRVKNVGTCTWTTDYKLVFIDGHPNLNQTDIPLPHAVQPGETVELRITFVAPEEGNTYIASWKLADENGTLFGAGPLADQPIEINFIIEKKVDSPLSC